MMKLVIIGGLIFLGSCQTSRTILKQAPTLTPQGWQPVPRFDRPVTVLRHQFETHIYGRVDLSPTVRIERFETLADHDLSALATLSQWRLSIDYGAEARPIDIVLLMPKNDPGAPVILSQNFCPNNAVIPLKGVRAPDDISFDCSGGGMTGLLMSNLFGRYIVTPPLEDILSRGYAVAALYPSQFIPDSAERGPAVLNDLFPEDALRPGALATWTSLFDVSATLIEAEYGERSMIAYGHSRFGKTALMAAAWSDKIDGAIAHQSGTLGASSLTDKDGEPLSALLEAYPHWVGQGLFEYAETPARLPVRPADLLFMTDAKPVLLGNARRDVWSDPWGAFKEAKAAWGDDFQAQHPQDFQPEDRKAYWLRPGTHGVVKEDWPAFLDFLDAHFKD